MPSAASNPEDPALPPPRPELPAYVVATSKQGIELSALGTRVLVLGARGPYAVDEEGGLVVSPLRKGLEDRSVVDIVGTGPDDAWALTAHEAGELSHIYYDVARWGNGAWLPVPIDAELSDVPGTWFEGFVATSRATAVALSHDASPEGGIGDVLSSVHTDGGTSRNVGSAIGVGARAIVGMPSGDVYFAAGGVLAHVAPGGQERVIPLPAIPGGAIKEANITALSSDARSGALVVALHALRANAPATTAVATLRGMDWRVIVCPFADIISRVATTPDGALWAGTEHRVWRHSREWDSVTLPSEGLHAAGLAGNVTVGGLVAIAADDAWIAVAGVPGGKPSALLHTKPSVRVQSLPFGGAKAH